MKTVIEMAREANIKQAIETPHLLMVNELERFAELVRADEREACAKVCDRYTDSCSDHETGTALNIQDAIRARSNT